MFQFFSSQVKRMICFGTQWSRFDLRKNYLLFANTRENIPKCRGIYSAPPQLSGLISFMPPGARAILYISKCYMTTYNLVTGGHKKLVGVDGTKQYRSLQRYEVCQRLFFCSQIKFKCSFVLIVRSDHQHDYCPSKTHWLRTFFFTKVAATLSIIKLNSVFELD